jgi:hypothetical protein
LDFGYNNKIHFFVSKVTKELKKYLTELKLLGGIKMSEQKNENRNEIFLMMIALGSLCGLIEVVGSNTFHQLGLHFSGLLIGLDSILIAILFAFYKEPLLVIGMSLVACAFKQLVVPVLSLSFLCKLNSCLAIVLEFSGIAGMLWVMRSKIQKNLFVGTFAAAIGVFIGSLAYYFVGMKATPCTYMLSFNIPGGLINFILKEGLVWTFFVSIFFPTGLEIGEKLKEKTKILILQKPNLFRLSVVFTIMISVLISVISILTQS